MSRSLFMNGVMMAAKSKVMDSMPEILPGRGLPRLPFRGKNCEFLFEGRFRLRLRFRLWWRLRLGRAFGWPFLQGLDGEGDAFHFGIRAQDFYLDDLAGLDRIRGVLDVTVGKLADMDQPVLMNADVHESSELGHVGHHTFQHHAGLYIGEFAHLLVEAGRDELVAGVTSRFA